MTQTQKSAPRPSVTPPDQLRQDACKCLRVPAGEQRQCPFVRGMTRSQTDILAGSHRRTGVAEVRANSLPRGIAEIPEPGHDCSQQLGSTRVGRRSLLDHQRAHIRLVRRSQCIKPPMQVAVFRLDFRIGL